jgi:hypothetical protein
MKLRIVAIFMLALLVVFTPAVAQQTADGDQIVSVPKKYVSAEGLNHQAEATVSKWIGMGKEIGVATREGLDAVVGSAEKFGTTKVGTFVMVMIAWNIMAKSILGIILGIPMLIGGVFVWMWGMRRVFFGYRVLDKKEGHTKFYKEHEPIEFSSRDARACAAVFMYGAIVVWVGVMIFAVIF